MSIWLWAVVFLTWCAFFLTFFRFSAFRKLNQHVENLELQLQKTERARQEAETYINEQHEALNEWSEAYAEQNFFIKCQSDLFDEWIELDAPRKQYDSFAEVDDLLVRSTTKEFIRLMAWKRAIEEKSNQPVVNLNVQKDLRNVVDDITDNYKKIRGHFSEEGHEDIENLIEQEKLNFLKR